MNLLPRVFQILQVIISKRLSVAPAYKNHRTALAETKYRKVSNHASVNYLYKESHGSIDVLKGQVDIKHFNTAGQHIFTTKNSRTIIVISKDEENTTDSYFIDIVSNDNRPTSVSFQEKLRHKVHMRYYSDTQSYNHNPGNWSKFDHGAEDLFFFSKPVEWGYDGEHDNYYDTDYLAREEQNRDIGNNQEGYPITVSGLGGAANTDSKSWNVVTIFNSTNNQPQYTPTELIDYSGNNYARTSQAWAYKHNSNIIDVIVKRAKSTNSTGYNNDVIFSVPDTDNMQLKLPGGKDYGFARFRKTDGNWTIDSNYQINLVQRYPITASISGPTDLDVGQQGTWTVDASSPPGAPGSFSYEWYLKSDDPQASGYYGPLSYTDSYSTQMYDFDKYLDLKVIVSRDSEIAVPVHHVLCNNCGIGGGGGPLLYDQSTSEFDLSRKVKEHPDSVQTKSLLKEVNVTKKSEDHLPKDFTVFDPYPNPFNPVTAVPFALPDQSHVKIQVYNMLGREVATLADKTYKPGRYKVSFNANEMSSGIYFIQTKINDQIFNKKVTLIK